MFSFDRPLTPPLFPQFLQSIEGLPLRLLLEFLRLLLVVLDSFVGHKDEEKTLDGGSGGLRVQILPRDLQKKTVQTTEFQPNREVQIVQRRRLHVQIREFCIA